MAVKGRSRADWRQVNGIRPSFVVVFNGKVALKLARSMVMIRGHGSNPEGGLMWFSSICYLFLVLR